MKRRGNGLDADSYAPLIDLAPHLADRMLDALREAGVAAYVTPTAAADPAAGSGLEPGLEAGPEPGLGADLERESLDRLFVDTAMRSAAEGVLHVHLTSLRDSGPPVATEGDLLERTDEPGRAQEDLGPGSGQQPPVPGERDEDAIWAEIVAGFDAEPPAESPWPDTEDVPEAREQGAGQATMENADRTGRLPAARVIKSVDEPPPPDEDGHYIPPPPPPLPSADKVTKAAWIALVGGPVYLLITVLLSWQVPGWAAFLAVASFIGGFVTLVLRMGDDPRDNDDGAVI